MKRSPLRRGTVRMRRTPLRVVSPRRRAERTRRNATLAEVVARDGDGCYAARRIGARPSVGAPPTCAGLLDGHELIPRSAWPGGHLAAWNVRMVCRRHHDWIHDHPITAMTLGLLSRSWEQRTAEADSG